jgi:hypothetical protein
MKREEPGDAPMSAEDQEFAAYLQRRSLLAEHGDEGATPPARLDAQVLRAAHEAVTPAALRRAPLTRWALPATLAAALLVSIGFLMHSGLPTATRPQSSSTAGSQSEALRETAPADRAVAAASKVQQPARAESDPRAWLARIEALRAQGKPQQADAELQRLRAAFPDYPLTGAQESEAARRAAPAADRTPK